MSAVGGDDVAFLGIVFEEARHIGAGAFFECFEDARFVLAALLLLVSAKSFVDVTAEIEANVGTDAVLEVFQGGGWWLVVRAEPGNGFPVGSPYNPRTGSPITNIK